VVTPAGLEDFFLELGREAIDGETETVTPTPEDIQKLLQIAPKYGKRSGCRPGDRLMEYESCQPRRGSNQTRSTRSS
jgi:hypothetical protein